MIVASHVLRLELGFLAPNRVGHARAEEVEFVVGVGIAETTVDSVHIAPVFHQVKIQTEATVGRFRLVSQFRGNVLAIGLSVAQLKHGKILVFQVHAQCRLVLSIVAESHLRHAHEVGRHGQSVEKRDGFVFQFNNFLLHRLCTDRQRSHQQATTDKNS